MIGKTKYKYAKEVDKCVCVCTESQKCSAIYVHSTKFRVGFSHSGITDFVIRTMFLIVFRHC